MAYTGKKPIDHTDVTQSQSMTVTDDLTVDTDTLYVDSANNRVGIGTSSPSASAHIYNDMLQVGSKTGDTSIQQNANAIRIAAVPNSSTEWGGLQWYREFSDVIGAEIIASRASSAETDTDLIFKTSTNSSDAVEVMRLDHSGNVLVGTTSTTPQTGDHGFVARANGYTIASVDGARVMLLNRDTSDGEILNFRKESSTVGSIGVDFGDNLFISGNSSHAGINFGTASVTPYKNGATADNSLDLGSSIGRWDDIFATNATIQTSDQNEKQQIASLTTAEITAAKAISKLFKTFKWNDSVTENGDNARTHTGVIAQDVQQAMTDAGLDAGDYAFFISTTWWEADEAYTDDDGNAQTRTNTYDTQADAPDGATERTRLGIRYPELLAFVGAATEQRLADIETRLTALEATD